MRVVAASVGLLFNAQLASYPTSAQTDARARFRGMRGATLSDGGFPMRASPGAPFHHKWQTNLVVVLLLVPLLSTSARQVLPERYKKWLERDVAYIVTNEEKKVFLDLPSNADRDRFIEHFWEVRNPSPGSPDNAYRSEHYRRMEYANQYFGHVAHTEGWRTDMGRVYITLGEPQQRSAALMNIARKK